VNGDLWVLALRLKDTIDVHGVVIILLIKSSGEVVELDIQLSLGLWKRSWATIFIDVSVDDLVFGHDTGGESDSRDATEESQKGEFHF
jgi:hypothetical protein